LDKEKKKQQKTDYKKKMLESHKKIDAVAEAIDKVADHK